MSQYEASLRRHLQEIARKGTTVDVHGVDLVIPRMDSCYYFETLNALQIMNKAIQAEKEGYDAVCIGCMRDPGFFELWEILEIPVAFVSQVSMYLACLLSDKFALLGRAKGGLLRVTDRVNRYGLQDRMVPGGYLNATMEELQKGFEEPEPIVKQVIQIGRQLINNGASMIITECNMLNMILVEAGLRDVDGVPILDTTGALIKAAEFMVDLRSIGITRSKNGLFSHMKKEEVVSVQKLYGV
jgi:Asp/Glu/hydantoin racemase